MIKKLAQMSQVRYKVVQAIDVSLEQPDQKEETNQILRTTYQEFIESPFSLDSIVFGSIVHKALGTVAQEDEKVLRILRDKLLGQVPSRNTYALKYNFVELLQGEAYEAYEKLRSLLPLIADRVGASDIPSHESAESEAYEDLGESLYELCYEKMQTCTIADLLVAQGCQVLLSLPDDGSEYFDITSDKSSYSSIYPVSSIEAVDVHLKYVEGILERLEGKAVLFVDVHLLPEGFVLNLR